ncbi:MFS transporter [Agrobacterium larrymoorei]|uniref:MFS family permease n=1 Tax=Agrobacterium larrymoorei TaxID=160699 RepID=A0ABU0UKK5_9HYPH|nr:MFS transporter [Agrobacterium larrymoorei]MDQ1185469.1 MFS family permease [Agrobacterium larrymoorei]
MKSRVIVFTTLAITQIAGWGVIGILPVLASSIAKDLQVDLATAFLGVTAMYVVMGLSAPLVGKAFARLGVKHVMLCGAGLIGMALAAMASVNSLAAYLACWCAIGVGGAMFLTTSAYAYLAEFAGNRARGMIGSLMLVTGLAGSVFWPLTAWLDHLLGWRGVTQIYGGGVLLLVLPLLALSLPDVRSTSASPVSGRTKNRRGHILWFLVAAISLNSFVTLGMESVGIELFKALGADLTLAVGLASFMGVLKVGGRLIDVIGGQTWNAIWTGILSGAMIPAAMLIPVVFGPSSGAIFAYIVIFGIGSGAFAVARATMPLEFYEKSDYAAAMSMIGLPMNLVNATAPPLLSGLMAFAGPSAMLLLMVACSGAALCSLLTLGHFKNRQRGLVA